MNGSEETLEVVESAEVEVNEEEVGWRMDGETHMRKRELNVETPGMFEFGSWQEALSKAG